MPCVCARCEQHSRSLGLARIPASRAALRRAFRATAKQWHPDRFEKQPDKQREAEERFKQIQVAYRELLDHQENPEEWLVEIPFASGAKTDDAPPIDFGGERECFVAPYFPPFADRIIAAHVREPDRALAMVDLSGPAWAPGTFTQYILLTSHGVFVRDALSIVSLLWHHDLGGIRLVDRRKHGRLSLWQRLVEQLCGTQQKYALEIYRRDGTLFHAIASQVDDRIKKVIYNFLQQKKHTSHQ
jgi:hypothetical protein